MEEQMTDDATMTRRRWITSMMGTIAGGSALMTLLPSFARADAVAVAVTVYKDPSCGCCKKWVAHLTQNGFTPVVKDRTDMSALKDSLGIPVALRSCHTAIAGKLVIEGHVPASDVKHFLATPIKGVLGLAAPGMPSGSPGMEMPGQSDRYDVVAFTADGKTSVFATH
jgi:hypothetical protein